ncbi:serine aminopeptidase domain-containing protein [Chloroflexota bacterium]
MTRNRSVLDGRPSTCELAHWGTESLDVIEFIKQNQGIDLPVIFVHGEHAPFFTADGVRRFFDQIKHPDNTIHIIPNNLHETHNDLDHQIVIAGIERWMTAHIS